jgi:hypothetical protein
LLRARIIAARQHRYLRRACQALCLRLVAHRANRRWRRADPDQAGVEHGLGERGALSQEPVAGVDRLRPALQRGRDDRFDVEVGLARQRTADAYRCIGLAHVQRGTVGLGVHRDRPQTQAASGTCNPPCDLPAVGDQYAGEAMQGHRRGVPMSLAKRLGS